MSHDEERDEAHQAVPQGRFGRLARLALTGVRAGASMLREQTGHAAAKQAAEVLGQLRGLAAKAGQMASYVDGVVPEQHREAYELAMKKLRAAAPTSSPAEVRAVLEQELGAPPEKLFATWEERPFASASIGQVHRAVLEDGREVAVKVQHPGIAAAVESDLQNAGLLESMAFLKVGRRVDTKTVLEAIQARMREELDYTLEAQRLVAFTELHRGDPDVRLPGFVPERSTGRVLTTELVRGLDFDKACEAPEALRQRWVEAQWRFVFRGSLVAGLFNADPHPGNYLFHEDGGVTFLDHGCVQVVPPPRRRFAVAMHRAAGERDEEGFRVHSMKMVNAKPGRLEAEAHRYVRHAFEPLFQRPYRITRPYAASLVTKMKDMAELTKTITDEEFFSMPADMIFMNRLQFGFYSVVARLDVTVDYAALEEPLVVEAERVLASLPPDADQ